MGNLFNRDRWKMKDAVFFILVIACLSPIVSSPIALLLGFSLSTLGGIPSYINTQALSKKLLAYSIIGLGFGINLDQAIAASLDGIWLILVSIFSILMIGWLMTKLLYIDTKTGYLVASGTAICGGSAIAAVAPAINAKDNQTSIALAVVFFLNSVALFIFPVIGELLQMSQHAFGVWCAIAIHDTSSVVGAASAYGNEALLTATTLKLARALWIVPIAFMSAILFKGENKKINIPYFILFYCVAILISHFLPQFSAWYVSVFAISKKVLVLCLFFIGAGITINKIKDAGIQPLLLGIILWIMIASGSLIYIENIM